MENSEPRGDIFILSLILLSHKSDELIRMNTRKHAARNRINALRHRLLQAASMSECQLFCN